MTAFESSDVVLLGPGSEQLPEVLGLDSARNIERIDALREAIESSHWPVVIASVEVLKDLPSDLRCVMLATGSITAHPCHIRVVGHLGAHLKPEYDAHTINAALTLRKELVSMHNQVNQAHDELEEFVHTVGHDLKSPIQGIMGLAGLLMEQSGIRVFPALAKFAERIETDAERLSDMISALTRFARLGKTDDPSAEVIELTQVLDSHSARLINAHPNLIINFQLEGHLGAVWARPPLVELIVGEVLDNCIHFRGDAPPIIKASFSVSDDGDQGVLRLSDNGAGLAPHGLSSALQMFTRLDRKRSVGVGAGLALARRAAQLCGGSLSLESVLGEGTTAVISLPLSPN